MAYDVSKLIEFRIDPFEVAGVGGQFHFGRYARGHVRERAREADVLAVGKIGAQ
ncbi:hypothetical protein D3C87_2136030 [compost metagenome]